MIDTATLLTAGLIFLLRVLGNMITTVRLITLMRGEKFWSAVLGFFESLIFAIAIGSVVSNLDDIWNLMAYCLGYAVGGYLGQLIEYRMVRRYISITAISPAQAHDIALAIRGAGFGATESSGRGALGEVGSVKTVVTHHDVKRVLHLIQEVDPQAFVTTDEMTGIAHGHFRLARPEQR